jgi:hypothetical protein
MAYLGKPIPGITGYYVLINGVSYTQSAQEWDAAEALANTLDDLMPVFDVEIVGCNP